jgi:hypothetical protein
MKKSILLGLVMIMVLISVQAFAGDVKKVDRDQSIISSPLYGEALRCSVANIGDTEREYEITYFQNEPFGGPGIVYMVLDAEQSDQVIFVPESATTMYCKLTWVGQSDDSRMTACAAYDRTSLDTTERCVDAR